LLDAVACGANAQVRRHGQREGNAGVGSELAPSLHPPPDRGCELDGDVGLRRFLGVREFQEACDEARKA
jgi:hypothetical protein